MVRSDVTIRMSRDPKDDKFLEYAVAGGADYLVSGAEDLLVLGEVPGIPIVDAPTSWQKLLTEGSERDHVCLVVCRVLCCIV